MSNGKKCLVGLVGCVIIVYAVLAQPVSLSKLSIDIQNSDNVPFFRAVHLSGARSRYMIELWNNPTNGPTFYVPANGILPSAEVGIQSGTNLLTGTSVTNTFATPYASPPRVVACGSDVTATCGVTNVTTTNFIVVGHANEIINWIAVAQ